LIRQIGRPVAIKFLFTGSGNSSEDNAEFFRELRILGNIRQNDAVSVYDCGEFETLPYIVMECLEGQDLSKAISAKACGSLAQRITIARQIAEAMEKVHSASIVHRDLKPANIFIEKSGRIKLMDFGIARSASGSGSRASRLIGTPQYISPEQVKGLTADFRSDIYSYGILLFELFAETPPFRGSPAEVLFGIVYKGVPLQLLQVLALPRPLIDLLRRATAADRDNRPQTFREVIDELTVFESAGMPGQRRSPGQFRKLAIVAAALCVMVGGGAAILRWPAPARPAPNRPEAGPDSASASHVAQQPASNLHADPPNTSLGATRTPRTEPITPAEPSKRVATVQEQQKAQGVGPCGGDKGQPGGAANCEC
jgi:serine/threonine protein kinase